MQITHSPFEYPQQTRQWGEPFPRQKSQPTQIGFHSPSIPQFSHHSEEYCQLKKKSALLEETISQAQTQYTKMLEMFQGLVKIEKGERIKFKQGKRRTPEDILMKHPCPYCTKVFTTDSSMKRHIKIKHLDVGVDPPFILPAQGVKTSVQIDVFDSNENISHQQNEKQEKIQK